MTVDLATLIESRNATVVSWFVPIKLRNPLNNREHWRKVSQRAATEREETVLGAPKGIAWRLPVVVVLRRCYTGREQPFDRLDNLPAALKHVTDGVAEVVGLDDRDERFHVQYEQERVAKDDAGVLVTVVQGARVRSTLELVG